MLTFTYHEYNNVKFCFPKLDSAKGKAKRIVEK